MVLGQKRCQGRHRPCTALSRSAPHLEDKCAKVGDASGNRKNDHGDSQRGKSVHEGYGFISDEELIRAIDGMTFDHGETQILVTERKRKSRSGDCTSGSAETCEQNVSIRKTGKRTHNVTI